MNNKLRDLVGQASTRVAATKAEREAKRMQTQQEEQNRDAEEFKQKVESVLGKEVLEAIGRVTFNKDYLRQSMMFVQDSRTFRLQQETGFLVQLEENGKPLVHQFNLNNDDSKDTFLHILGTALREKAGGVESSSKKNPSPHGYRRKGPNTKSYSDIGRSGVKKNQKKRPKR
jgi:hypothetical protein